MTRIPQIFLRPDGTVNVAAAMAAGNRERAAAASQALHAVGAALRHALAATGAPEAGRDAARR